MANPLASMIRGDSLVFDVTLNRASDPIDLTEGGTEIWFTLKLATIDDDPGIVQKTVGSGISVLNETVARVTLDPEDTDSIADTVHQVYYDFQVKEGGSGKISTPLYGTMTIKPDITRSTS